MLVNFIHGTFVEFEIHFYLTFTIHKTGDRYGPFFNKI